MSSYDEELTTAFAGLPPLEAKARKEKNLRHAAQGMAAYLKAKENGPGIVRDVLRMTDKIRRNPTLANDIKAGEVELKDALQALSIAGKTPSSTAAREINVLNYVSPFSGEEESTRATFERWRRDWDVCHVAIMAAGATEADAYHRLLAAMSPGNLAHSLVLRHQRSPSQFYSLAIKALEEAYGDLVL
ncbi:Hypothetical protein FKW44_010451 [Caligus rogercresseyi]|uniref:Uncharacterized protein n=1 Tax=Caligus rogercresseyi TaxID=217165 RepID=A0A7T8HGS6_CALRO|nr:Hypothetical protein FKW44_010451 [Caligus rogercresseyi]